MENMPEARGSNSKHGSEANGLLLTSEMYGSVLQTASSRMAAAMSKVWKVLLWWFCWVWGSGDCNKWKRKATLLYILQRHEYGAYHLLMHLCINSCHRLFYITMALLLITYTDTVLSFKLINHYLLLLSFRKRLYCCHRQKQLHSTCPALTFQWWGLG